MHGDTCAYVRDLLHQLFDGLQLDCSRVAPHDVPHGLDVPLQALDQRLVGRSHAAALELGHLQLQAPRVIGQLPHDGVPEGEAAVAGLTGGELALVAPGARVAARPVRPLRARALARCAVALLAGDSTRVAIAGWEHKPDVMRKTVCCLFFTLLLYFSF